MSPKEKRKVMPKEGGDLGPITEVADGIFRIGPLENYSRTPNTSPFLVVGEERAAIMEPGEGGQVPELLDGIKEIGVSLDRIAYIIPTHIHLHHCAAVNELLKQLPQATMVAHERAVPHLVEPTRLNEGTFAVWGEGCPQLSPVPRDRILSVAGGEVLDLGGRELEIVDAGGHAPHMFVVFDRRTKTLFAGDVVGVLHLGMKRGRPDILPPLFNVERHIESVHRVRALKAERLLIFGWNGGSQSAEHVDKLLQWQEEDVRAVERICLEGMKKGTSSAEIGQKVSEYYESVGAVIPHFKMPEERKEEEKEGRRGSQMAAGAPFGMVAYLMKKYPDLKRPK